MPGPSDAGLGRPAAILFAGLLAGKATGFVRDVVIAARFGSGAETDVFWAALTVLDLARDLLTGIALSAGLVPVLAESLAGDSIEQTRRLAGGLAGFCAVGLVVSVLALWLAAPVITWGLVPGFSPERAQQTTTLMRWLVLALFPMGMAGVLGSVLNVFGRFAIPAFSPVVMNAAVVGAVAALAGGLGMRALAAGFLAGGAAQFALSAWAAARMRVPVTRPIGIEHPAVRRLGALVWPMLVGQGATYVGIILARALASWLPGGSLSALSYAVRVNDISMGVIGTAMATAAFPALAIHAASARTDAFTATLGRALRIAFLLAWPLGLLFVTVPVTLVSSLFQRGAFGAAESAAAGEALRYLAGSALAAPLVYVLARAYFALGDTRTPVRLGAIGLAVNFFTALMLMGPMGYRGLALASSIGVAVQAALFLAGLSRRLGHGVVRELGRVMMPAAVGGLGIALAAAAVRGVASPVAAVAILGAAGGTWYAVSLWGLGVPEARDVGRWIGRRGWNTGT